METKFERDPLDYLKHIEKSLREAPHKQVNGGVLVAEILVDSIDGWCEFLREVIAEAEKSKHEGSLTKRAADGWNSPAKIILSTPQKLLFRGELASEPAAANASRSASRRNKMSEQEEKVLYYCREWYRTGREVIKQTLWYEIGVMLENEPDAEQGLHLTGLTPLQKEEVREMIQNALDTGSA